MTIKKQLELNCFKNLTTNQVVFCFEKSLGDEFVKKTPNTNELTEFHHMPSCEIFDDCLLITVGKILHQNYRNHYIEKIVMQNGENVREWNVKEKTKKGFPAVVSVSRKEIPKGETNFFVYCSEDGLFKLTQFFPTESHAFPAVMFSIEGTSNIVVRFPDLPCVVGGGKTKDEAYENAKQELMFALLCEENKNVVPTELEKIKEKHPSAFLIEI